MAYIPPAVHARPNRPAFVRPSGEPRLSIEVGNFPPGGHAYLDGVELPMLPGPTDTRLTWTVGAGNVFRVTNADGSVSREASLADRPSGETVRVIDWNTMDPSEDPDSGTLRVFGAPHTQLLVNGVLQSGSEAGGVVTYGNLPTGTYGVVINAADGFRWTPVVNIVRGQTTQLPLVRPAAPVVESGPRPTVDFTMGGGFNIGGAGGGSAASGFTITGIPATATGLAVRIDGQTANGTLAGGVWTASGTLVAGRSVMAQVRLQQGAGLSAFLLAPVERRVDAPAAGAVSVPFSSFAAPSAAAPPAPATGNLTVTGMPGWVVAIALPGSTTPLAPPATIPPTGGITVPAPVGSYDLAVNDGTRPIQVRRITVTAAGRTVDTRTFFDVAPTPAPAPAPTPTPTPAPAPQGATQPVRTDTALQPVDAMCGPVLNRAALPWAPTTACPGNELTATDGTRWRALAATGGVTLAQLRSDGTPAPAGMGLGTKVLIVGVVAAAGYAGWMWYSNRKPSGGKQENPGKCPCGG